MKTINYDILRDFFIRNWKNIVIIILAILLFKSCGNGNSELILEAKKQKEIAEMYLDRAILSQNKNIDLSKKESKYKDSIANLKVKVTDLLADQKIIKYEVKKELTKIKNFKSSEIANYIKKEYNVGSEQVINLDFLRNQFEHLLIILDNYLSLLIE